MTLVSRLAPLFAAVGLLYAVNGLAQVAEWSGEPRCVGQVAPAVEPISPDLIGHENQYKLHGNVTHSASCVDADGNRHVRYVTVHDCFTTWNNAPPGYCYSDKTMGQPVAREYIEYPPEK